jgi:cysteine desulfurase/selenocysteine lyase
VPEDGASQGLDVAVLAKLANEFFAALPGQEAPVPVPATQPSMAGGGGTLPAPATGPSISDAPSSLLEIPTPPAPVAPVQPTVQPMHAAVPLIGSAPVPGPVSAPLTPYYFLAEASPFPDKVSTLLPAAPGPTHIEPEVIGFPGEAALQDLLTVLPAALVADRAPVEDPERYYIRPVTDRPSSPDPHPAFDVNAVRRDFPILSERVHGRQLVWLDNAATTQKPRTVIDRLAWFYGHENSNIHRAAHELAARATDAYEGARSKVARFLGAGSAEEIIFVRGATEGINLVAQSWGRQNVHEGDEIVISHLEHHANIVPWQQLVSQTGAVLKVIPVDNDGQVLLDEYQKLLGDRTKLVAVAHVSNALGTVTPIRELVDLGHRAGACVLVDGAQSVPHMRVDMQALDADFFVLSGHKIFGPTGIGAVFGKASVLEAMPPWQGGGSMIREVTLESSLYQDPPTRFEAGTGSIADAVGLGAALDYLDRLGIENVERYEHELLGYATQAMLEVPGLRLIGTAPHKASILSFVLEGYSPEQVGQALNREGIAVRAGHHCAQPILRRFGLEATVRPSLALYNTTDEVDQMVGVLRRLVADAGRGRR